MNNKFCKKCGIICLRNGDKCNDSKRLNNKYYCKECFNKLKKETSQEDKYYIKNNKRKIKYEFY